METIFVSSICVFTLFFQSLAFGDLSDGNASICICDWNLKRFICIPLHALSYGCPPCVMWRWFCPAFSLLFIWLRTTWSQRGNEVGKEKNGKIVLCRSSEARCVCVCLWGWFLFVLKISIPRILHRLERVNISIRGRVFFYNHCHYNF